MIAVYYLSLHLIGTKTQSARVLVDGVVCIYSTGKTRIVTIFLASVHLLQSFFGPASVLPQPETVTAANVDALGNQAIIQDKDLRPSCWFMQASVCVVLL